MRAIRLFFLAVLAILLVLVATANRGAITVSLVPESLSRFTGGQWSATMPAFLALFLAMVFGLIVGLVWEWMREAGIRAEAKARAQELARLEREVGEVRRKHAVPRDEVLAILDEPTARAGTQLPAPR